MTEPNTHYIIRYDDGSYNYGEGFDVTKSEATIYSTLEEAQEQSEGLCGVECIEEVCGGVKMTKDQVLKQLADGLIEYWHDEEGDASDILPELIISILGTETPELLQQTEKLSEQLFNEND